jgi:hypothetical protein
MTQRPESILPKASFFQRFTNQRLKGNSSAKIRSDQISPGLTLFTRDRDLVGCGVKQFDIDSKFR